MNGHGVDEVLSAGRVSDRPLNGSRSSIVPRVVDIRAEIERVYRERFATYVGATAGIVGSREQARDVVQDGFTRALTHEARFRGGSLEAWIWQIVLNRARDVRRKPSTVELRDDDPGAVDLGDTPLTAAVLGLSERRRTIVLLRYVAGLQNTEIAEALGISPGTVAARLSQARAQLASFLDREGTPG
jgi:RNA polymerase sigma factor (sigma-70 family)